MALVALAVSLAMAAMVVWVVQRRLPPTVHLRQVVPVVPVATVAQRAMGGLVVQVGALSPQVTMRKSRAVSVAWADKDWQAALAAWAARQRLQALLSMRQAAQGGMLGAAPTSQGLAALAAQVDLLSPPGQATSWRSAVPVALADSALRLAVVGPVALHW